MRIVADTNIIISAIFWNGFPRRVIDAVIDGRLAAYVCAEIIEEYISIYQEMLNAGYETANLELLTSFIAKAVLIKTTSSVKVCRDPDDDKFLECALDAQAKYIVSGDKDLLVLKEYEGIQIVTAHEFYDLCPQSVFLHHVNEDIEKCKW